MNRSYSIDEIIAESEEIYQQDLAQDKILADVNKLIDDAVESGFTLGSLTELIYAVAAKKGVKTALV